ncbi:MAG: response regulator, partial [Haloarculaceae archaeon]
MPSAPSEIRALVLGPDPGLAAFDETTSAGTATRFDVRRTATASEAARALDRRAFDCLVVDDASSVDALGFVATVRGDDHDLPVVFAVDSDDDAVIEDALSAGADDFFRKTAGSGGVSGLVNRVHALVGRHRARRRVAECREKASQLDTIFEDLPVSLYFKDREARHVRVSEGHAT